MNHMSKYDLRLVRTDYQRQCAYVTNGAFMLRLDRFTAERINVGAWVREPTEESTRLVDAYIKLLDSVESVLDVHTMSVTGADFDVYPATRKLRHRFASLSLGDERAPFAVGLVGDLLRCGLCPDRIVHAKGTNVERVLLFAGGPTTRKIKGGRWRPQDGDFPSAAILMCGSTHCNPSGEMVLR